MKRSSNKKADHRSTSQSHRKGRRLWLAGLAVLACLAVAGLAILQPWRPRIPLPESLTATSVVILNGEGDMMAEREADAPRSPSSLTKMLSIYLILDELDRGELSLSDTFTVPPEIANTRGSKYGLRTGQTVTVEQLLAGTILNSGCDCVHALIRMTAGDEATFVEWMNEKAKELGLKNSHFVNATGLDAADHYMTARDLATLAYRLVRDHPEYLRYSSQAEMEIDGLTFRNLNRLVGADPRVLGLKTGTTLIGGNNLVTYAEDGADACFIILLDSASETRRFTETEELLDLVLGGAA